jgi:cytochrome c oxidase assembly protein subunit 15
MSTARHRFAVTLALLVAGLISAGALVTSKGAGLSVPDWPLSFGMVNPPRWWQIDTVRAEHGHRLYAATVGLLTIVLAVWTQRRDPRRAVRRLGWTALAAVVVQGLLGGLTVRFFLPDAISVAHAGLAEAFLCMVVAMAVVTSPRWPALRARGGAALDAALAPRATALTAIVFAQILLGAVMRHGGHGLAIPTFPLAWGRLVPASFGSGVAIHFAHRVGAVVVLLAFVAVAARVLGRHRAEAVLTRPVAALALLLATQIALGAAVVLTGRAMVPNTLHVLNGALVLGTSLVLTMGAWRLRERAPRAAAPAPAPRGLAREVA